MSFTEIPTGLKQPFYKHPLDGRTYYDTIEEALADNPYEIITVPPVPPSNTPTEEIETNRFIGQKVMIQNPPDSDSPCEYWFKNGITDDDLVKYTSEFDDSYEWEKIDAFGGGGGGSGGGVSSVGTVSLSNISYLTNAAIKSKVLGFVNDSYKLVYFTINAIISNISSSLNDTVVGTLSVAPAANTAISVYGCGDFMNAKGRIMSNGDIEVSGNGGSGSFSSNIVISGCFVTGAT